MIDVFETALSVCTPGVCSMESQFLHVLSIAISTSMHFRADISKVRMFVKVTTPFFVTTLRQTGRQAGRQTDMITKHFKFVIMCTFNKILARSNISNHCVIPTQVSLQLKLVP